MATTRYGVGGVARSYPGFTAKEEAPIVTDPITRYGVGGVARAYPGFTAKEETVIVPSTAALKRRHFLSNVGKGMG